MTIWNGKLMRENELSAPAKVVLGIAVLVVLAITGRMAVQNAQAGLFVRPWALGVVAVGVALVLAPGLGVARRLGIALIAVGALLTFA